MYVDGFVLVVLYVCVCIFICPYLVLPVHTGISGLDLIQGDRCIKHLYPKTDTWHTF